MPDPALKRYQGAAGDHYHRSKRQIPEEAFPWVTRARAEKFQGEVRENDVVLEYGCGYGWNLAALRCRRRIGYDVADTLREELESRGIEFVSSLEPIPVASVDVVICHHVLEHLLHPAKALEEMGRVVNLGGKLLLFVPAELQDRRRKYDAEEPNHHLYSWNVQTFGNLVRDCGFELKEIGHGVYGYDRFAAAKAVRYGLGETGFRILRRIGQWFRPLLEVKAIAVKRFAD